MAHSSRSKIFKAGIGSTGEPHERCHSKVLPDPCSRGCVTPKQIGHIIDSVDGDANEIDGYEDLPEDFQEKIGQAIKEGHVADEDWTGVNRGAH